MTKIEQRPVVETIDQTASFPYTPNRQSSGISIYNSGTVTVEGSIDTGDGSSKAIYVTAGVGYEADYESIKTINITAGDAFNIDIRGL